MKSKQVTAPQEIYSPIRLSISSRHLGFWRLKGCCAEFKGVHSASLSHTSLVTAFEREMLMVRDIPPYCLSYTYGVLMRI